MKKIMLTTGLIASVLLLTQTNALANNRFEQKIQQRQHNQSQRIENGFDRGELNYHELKRLLKNQFKFERLAQQFMQDGRYNHRERRILKRKYNKLDRMIYRMKHNQQKFRNFRHL